MNNRVYRGFLGFAETRRDAGGCGGDGDRERPEAARASDPEAVLRAWLQAVKDDDNERAASYFAPNAVETNPAGDRTRYQTKPWRRH